MYYGYQIIMEKVMEPAVHHMAIRGRGRERETKGLRERESHSVFSYSFIKSSQSCELQCLSLSRMWNPTPQQLWLV